MTFFLHLFLTLLYAWRVKSNDIVVDPTRCIKNQNWMDVVFLADTSCPMTETQCINQQRRIAKTLMALKGADDTYWYPSVRAAYVEFGSTGIEVVVPMNEKPYNARGGITNASIAAYSRLIQERCDQLTATRDGEPKLYDAIKAALKEFENGPTSRDLRKDRKVIIFSNCPASDIEHICRTWKHPDSAGRDVDFFMVNIGDEIPDPEIYIMCMVEYDDADIWVDTQRDDTLFYNDILWQIGNEMCEYPTPVPTTDPTVDPTIDPTIHPTADPTGDPTVDPTVDPTNDPTAAPTVDPTKDPTAAPTVDPTVDPTRDPTIYPTADPTGDPTANCHTHTMDLVILIDVATPMSYAECRKQQERVADAMIQLKGMEDDALIPKVRLSVIEMSSEDVYVRVAMNQYPYNRETGQNSLRERNELYDLIAGSGGCYLHREEETLSRKGNANVRDGLACALNQLEGSDPTRRQKILIFSNSVMDHADTEAVCQFYNENENGVFNDIDIFMYHRNELIDDDYLECLANGDLNKIFNNPTGDNRIYSTIILPALEQFMCRQVYN